MRVQIGKYQQRNYMDKYLNKIFEGQILTFLYLWDQADYDEELNVRVFKQYGVILN